MAHHPSTRTPTRYPTTRPALRPAGTRSSCEQAIHKSSEGRKQEAKKEEVRARAHSHHCDAVTMSSRWATRPGRLRSSSAEAAKARWQDGTPPALERDGRSAWGQCSGSIRAQPGETGSGVRCVTASEKSGAAASGDAQGGSAAAGAGACWRVSSALEGRARQQPTTRRREQKKNRRRPYASRLP